MVEEHKRLGAPGSQQIPVAVKAVGYLGLILVFGLLMPLILKGVIGTAALVVSAGLGYVAWKMAPVAAMKLANWKVTEAKREAGAHPIQTLWNTYKESVEDVDSKDTSLEEWDAELRAFDQQLIGIRRDYPEEASTYEDISRQMHDGLIFARNEQALARQNLGEMKKAVIKMERLYNMALAAQKVTAFSKTAEERVMGEISRQAAIDSVQNNLNRSLARLNTAMERRKTMSELPAAGTTGGTEVKDVTPSKVAVR